MAKSPAIILYDADGNPVSVITDGSVRRLASIGKLLDSGGTQINPAREDGNLSTLAGKDFATQTTLSSIEGKTPALVGGRQPVDGSGVTQPVSAVSLPLPAGAATEATLLLVKTKTDNIPADPAREGGNLADCKTSLDKLKFDGDNLKVLAVGGGGGGSQQVEGRGLAASSPVGNPVYVAGWDGSLLRALLTDNQGRLIVAPPGAKATLKGFVCGKVVLAATAEAQVNWTVYREQTSNAQRSIASTSADDTAAGTGARTVRVTYYSVSAGVITGPFTEVVTLNGTSYVNTVSTTIAFVEKVEVVTVGSSGTNAGILTLKAGTAGGGVTILTVGAGDGRTFHGHHYVPTGKTMYITGISIGIKGADSGSFYAKAKDLSNANVSNIQISDYIRVGASQSSISRLYGTPIAVPGPAHAQLFVAPDSTSSRTYFASMDFYEE